MIDDGALRTVDEAARELSVSVGTIRAWIYQRRLGYNRIGRSIRIPAEEIRRVLTGGFMPAEVGLSTRKAPPND